MASLRSKIETSLLAAFTNVADNVYVGLGADQKLLPCVIVRAVSAEDVVPNAGRYIVTVEIMVQDTASNESTFDDLCAAVAAITDGGTLATSLTTADLYVYGFAASSRVEWGTDGDSWTETRTIQIECAQTAVA